MLKKILSCLTVMAILLTVTACKGGENANNSDTLSIESVVNCALNANTVRLTFSEEAVNKAFETSEGANDGSNSTEWKALADTKKNWTITLS